MAKGPDFTGFGGYGPWPDNDAPTGTDDVSPHYNDGYANRALVVRISKGQPTIGLTAWSIPSGPMVRVPTTLTGLRRKGAHSRFLLAT